MFKDAAESCVVPAVGVFEIALGLSDPRRERLQVGLRDWCMVEGQF
jgi:hypothetical protein